MILTGFGRTRRMTERAAGSCRAPPTCSSSTSTTTRTSSAARRARRALGSARRAAARVAYAPPDALGGGFLDTPRESALIAYQTSAFSLKALAAGLLPLLEAAPDGAGVVGLDFDASSRVALL